MRHATDIAALALTVAGLGLIFQDAGVLPLWDALWVLALLAAGYAGFYSVFGLARARFCAGAALAVFAALEIFNGVFGWPLGPVRFAGPEIFRVAGRFSILPPLFATGLLLLSARAVAIGFPAWGGRMFAGGVAMLFSLTFWNGWVFFEKVRLWWLWNPWHETVGPLTGVSIAGSLGLLAYLVARTVPDDTALKLKRWGWATVLLAGLNVLFAAARTIAQLRAQ